MCGILAHIRSIPPREGEPGVAPRALQLAMSRLHRRGPDSRGVFESPDRRILLGHARLAIQDLTSAGAQPMTDNPADPRTTVSFNGEIYNAPALRAELERSGVAFRSRADTEVLIHGFAHWGFGGLLERLRGMFAFVLVDRHEPRSPRIYAAVDPAGMKPLLWSHLPAAHGGTLAIASDADALLALLSESPGFSRRINPAGLCHVLSVGYCPAPATVWRGLHKLRPGECLTWVPGDLDPPSVKPYWHPPESVSPDDARTNDERRFETLFREVIDDHLLSDVPVGLFLSAGLDSGSIALALAQAQRTSDVTAWTLASPGIDPAFDEAPIAAAFARGLMMRHRAIDFAPTDLAPTLTDAADAFDEPQGFSALLTAVRIARGARDAGLRVVLAGDGGDETFAGYSWHSGAPHALSLDPAHAVPARSAFDTSPLARPDCDASTRAAARLALAARSYTHRALCRAFPGFHPAESRALLAALEPEYDDDTFAGWLASEDRPRLPHPRRSQRLDVMGFCAGSILPKIDRAAMHVGLELRAPFLDRRVLDWALSRPTTADEAHPHRSKPMLRDFLARGVTAGLVPPAVLNRPKQGFSLRLGADRPIETLAASLLPGSRLIRDGVLRRDYTSFLPGDRDTRHVRLFTLCMLAAWYEQRAAA
ncbi:MAG: asparagine synthase (glutamine-hydrolyzing) [Phycisphaerales bacterium]|nr:asparagine synthase (glutamine-hydrolyzing) [Phycisphaerales bacterium]